jgi:hypothetical protein
MFEVMMKRGDMSFISRNHLCYLNCPAGDYEHLHAHVPLAAHVVTGHEDDGLEVAHFTPQVGTARGSFN